MPHAGKEEQAEGPHHRWNMTVHRPAQGPAVAETLAVRIAAIDEAHLSGRLGAMAGTLAIDIVGLCVAARNESYIASARAGFADPGTATVIGHTATASPAAAAFINGVAAHGEDFDDTFEGGPVHAGVVIVPGAPRYRPSSHRHRAAPTCCSAWRWDSEVMCRG